VSIIGSGNEKKVRSLKATNTIMPPSFLNILAHLAFATKNRADSVSLSVDSGRN
jgi:hypothetical protein